MAWIEVYGGQRSLAFELTTAILWVEIHNKCALGTMATMDDYEVFNYKTPKRQNLVWQRAKLVVKTSLDNTSKLILFELSTFPFFRSETQFRLLWQLQLVVKSRSHWWLDPSLLSDVLNTRWTCAFQALSWQANQRTLQVLLLFQRSFSYFAPHQASTKTATASSSETKIFKVYLFSFLNKWPNGLLFLW